MGIAIHVSFVLVYYELNIVLGVLSVGNKCSINEGLTFFLDPDVSIRA